MRTILSGIIAVSLYLILVSSPVVAEPVDDQAYWIYFTDKQGSEGAAWIDPHALERRQLRGTGNIPADVDLPVSQDYIEQVLAFNDVKLRGQSRWLNAISVEIPAASFEDIQKLSFVKKPSAQTLKIATISNSANND